ncbi:hypothetical protein ABZ663_25270, partial [Streptomyces albidoflavus]
MTDVNSRDSVTGSWGIRNETPATEGSGSVLGGERAVLRALAREETEEPVLSVAGEDGLFGPVDSPAGRGPGRGHRQESAVALPAGLVVTAAEGGRGRGGRAAPVVVAAAVGTVTAGAVAAGRAVVAAVAVERTVAAAVAAGGTVVPAEAASVVAVVAAEAALTTVTTTEAATVTTAVVPTETTLTTVTTTVVPTETALTTVTTTEAA